MRIHTTIHTPSTMHGVYNNHCSYMLHNTSIGLNNLEKVS